MAEWRRRGYVSDSDDGSDEGEPRSQDQHTVPAVTAKVENNNVDESGKEKEFGRAFEAAGLPFPQTEGTQVSKPQADKLSQGKSQTDSRGDGGPVAQPEDGSGSQDRPVGQVDSTKPTVTALRLLEAEFNLNASPSSRSSSPLSDAPSTIPELPRPLRESIDADLGSARDSLEIFSHVLLPFEKETNTGDRGANEVLRRSRHFRNRKPIQIHPYVLENAKFSKLQRDHGLNPGHLQSEYDKALRRAGIQTTTSVQTADPEPQSSQGSEEYASINADSPKSGLVDFDDEFPDLDTLFESRPTKSGTDRDESRHTKSINYMERPKAKELEHTTLSSPRDDDLFDVPMSPPQSRSHTPYKSMELPRFRRPPTWKPSALPTPLISSDPNRKPSPSASVITISDKDSDSDDQESNHNGPEESAPDPAADSQLYRAERRMRGVLPASWLKLDLKAQSAKAENVRQRLNQSPKKRNSLKGVARRVSKTQAPSKASDIPLNDRGVRDASISSSQTDEHERMRPLQSIENASVHSPTDFVERPPLDLLGEASEDDTVDLMLPPAKRPRLRGVEKPQSRKHVRGYEKEWRRRTRAPGNERDEAASHQPKITTSFTKVLEESEIPCPKLGILDSPFDKDEGNNNTPPFLRIASRTARSRRDKGRSYPRRKHFQFTVEQDERMVSETLTSWRKGHIQTKPDRGQGHERYRRPLRSLSGNAQPEVSNAVTRGTKTQPTVSRQDRAQQIRKSVTDSLLKSSRSATRKTSSKLRWNQEQIASSKHIKPVRNPSTRPKPLLTSLQRTETYRPAMLEGAPSHHQAYKRAHTLRDLLHARQPITEIQTTRNPLHKSRPPNGNARDITDLSSENMNTVSKIIDVERPRQVTKRPRKRPPQRRQPQRLDRQSNSNADMPIVDLSDLENGNLVETVPRPTIIGLGHYTTQYTDDFGKTPLPPGTIFHRSTLLGSGLFRSCLHPKQHTNSIGTGPYKVFEYEGKVRRWGPWNEVVASELENVLDGIQRSVAGLIVRDHALDAATWQDINTLQKSILSYITDYVTFYDSIDRVDFIERWKVILQHLVRDFRRNPVCGTNDLQHFCRVKTLNVIVANAIRQLSENEIVPSGTKHEVRHLLAACVSTAMETLKPNLGSIETCYGALGHQREVVSSLSNEYQLAEDLVILHHVIETAQLDDIRVFDILVDDIKDLERATVVDVSRYEKIWERTFCLLPFLEFDDQGVLEVGRRLKKETSAWPLVRRLILPIFQLYHAENGSQPPSLNVYIRALFRRCLHLLNGWGWYRGELIIGTLFDFFAKNKLNNLRNEDGNGSPAFLSPLTSAPILDAESRDRCFHILLKIIGSGLRRMRSLYPERKIRDQAWRLMPNHGRSHPKDRSIRQEDLDALRNHHDLLCTLYWALPPGFRPSLSAIRTLVDFEDSHREACHIAISAWRNLVCFQVASDEPNERLEGFQQWHDYILSAMLRQHGLARVEAEEHIRAQPEAHVNIYSVTLLESTIASNQRQVEAVLTDALISLEIAMNAAQAQGAAGSLLSASIGMVFAIYDSSKSQNSRTIIAGLDVLLAYGKKSLPRATSGANHVESEDSQEFGDWSAFNSFDLVEPQDSSHDHRELPTVLAIDGGLKNLLSNCFGADEPPSEYLLDRLVTTWISVAFILIQQGARYWGDFIDQFGKDSWASLRDTHQTRKYTPYFLACVIETDRAVYTSLRSCVLSAWIVSLVVRESHLRYQHTLTNALLNADAKADDILTNLPFAKDTKSGKFTITATELSERRVSLISSVVANMRISLNATRNSAGGDAGAIQQEYKELLRSLMTAMKHNYQELGAMPEVKNAYVTFVHHVIQALQEHAPGICSVDPFFTDDVAFPLPSKDPSYVIGRLRSYALSLRDQGTPKQLAIFFQTLFERAVVEGRQADLIGQLFDVLSDPTQGNLRRFVVERILPAYVVASFQHPCGWILAMPLLQGIRKVHGDLLLGLDAFDDKSIRNTKSYIKHFLEYLKMFRTLCIKRARNLPTCISVRLSLATCEAVGELIPVISYLSRLRQHSLPGLHSKALTELVSWAQLEMARINDGSDDADGQYDEEGSSKHTPSKQDPHSFALHQLKDTLKRNWHYEQGSYYLVRGGVRRRAMVDDGVEKDQQKLTSALTQMLDLIARVAPEVVMPVPRRHSGYHRVVSFAHDCI